LPPGQAPVRAARAVRVLSDSLCLPGKAAASRGISACIPRFRLLAPGFRARKAGTGRSRKKNAVCLAANGAK